MLDTKTKALLTVLLLDFRRDFRFWESWQELDKG